MKRLILLIKTVTYDSQLKKSYEKIEKAIREKAQLASDRTFNATMLSFYSERRKSIDPMTNWWDFASARENEVNHSKAIERFNLKLQEADAVIDAAKNAYLVNQERFNELPSFD